jgi:hypothetical protein
VNPFHLENATIVTLVIPSNASKVISEPTTYFLDSPLFKGNSLIVVNSDTLRVFLFSPKLPSFPSARIQTTRAS